MRFGDVRVIATLVAAGAFAVGAITGLALKLPFLGPLSNEVLALFGSILGTIIGSSATIGGAFYLWRMQQRDESLALGKAVTQAFALPHTGLVKLGAALVSSEAQDPDASTTTMSFTMASFDRIEEIAIVLGEANTHAKRNIERIATQLVKLGPLRTPWLIASENVLADVDRLVESVRDSKRKTLAGAAFVRFPVAHYQNARRMVTLLGRASFELQSKRPSLDMSGIGD